jgi:hypothetical protein
VTVPLIFGGLNADVTTGDFDGDSDLDLATLRYSTGWVEVFTATDVGDSTSHPMGAQW